MRLIVAIIRPDKLEAVRAALKMWEVCLFSISEVLGDEGESGSAGMYRGTKFHVKQSRLRLEIAVKDHFVEQAVEAIVRSGYDAAAARVGEIKVIVMPLDATVLSALTVEDSRLLNDTRESHFAHRG
jgi:nitrogen regulatory protein P-II 2